MREGSSVRERLRRQTGEARRHQAAVETEIERDRGQAARPGDLFVLPQSSELPVEWTILENDDMGPGRLLVVPADGNPMLGSADIAVPVDAERGALSLRCGFGVWTEAGIFAPELCTGRLETEHLERARQRLRDVEQGRDVGTVAERETDGETDYLDWRRDVLEPARSVLPEIPPMTAAAPFRRPEIRAPFRHPTLWSGVNRALAIAASILLAFSAFLIWQNYRAGRTIDNVERVHDREVAELEGANEQAAAAHRREIAELRAAGEQAEQEHRRRVEELEASSRPRPRLNLPFVVLVAARTRSPEAVQELPSGASEVALILQLEDPEPALRYRLRVVRRATGETVWSSDDLRPLGAELSLTLPGSLLPAGDYVIRLRGLGAGQEGPEEEYDLSVR
ncbi:MAG: hypothetical protein GY719_14815 [bacterium]|nr:hypothetical protein [bacterium]